MNYDVWRHYCRSTESEWQAMSLDEKRDAVIASGLALLFRAAARNSWMWDKEYSELMAVCANITEETYARPVPGRSRIGNMALKRMYGSTEGYKEYP